MPGLFRPLLVAVIGVVGCVTHVSAQELYVTNYSDNSLRRISASGVVTTIASGLNGPAGVAVDSNGNSFVANFGISVPGDSVTRVAPNGTAGTFASGGGMQSLQGVVFGPGGDLFIANDAPGTISRVNSSGVVSTFASGLTSPQGLAFDTHGDLFVSEIGPNRISRITAGGSVSIFATGGGLNAPRGLAFDTAGTLYAANLGNNSVSHITSLGAVTPFVSGGELNSPAGLAFDASGDLYVSNFGSNSISRIAPGGVVTPFATGLSGPNYIVFGAVPEPMGLLGIAFGVLTTARGFRRSRVN